MPVLGAPPGRARRRRLTPTSSTHPVPLCPDITGPIVLQTYRAIADYEKSSGSEMALAAGDVVDVVEKSQSGQPPALLGLPCCLHLWPQVPDEALPLGQPQASSPPGPGALTVLPTLWVTLSLSVHPGLAVGSRTYRWLHGTSWGHIRWAGQLLTMRVEWVPSCGSVTPCVGGCDLGVGCGEGDISESKCWMFVCLSVLTTPMAEGGCQARPDFWPHTLFTGWWFCQMKTKRGWVPASYLEPLDSPDEAEDPEPDYAGVPCRP